MKIRLGGSWLFGNPCRVCLGKLPMPVLHVHTADLFVHHCCHCVSGNWENVPCQQWYVRPCHADSTSYYHLPPASQELIKSHSWKAFTMQQFWFLLHIACNKDSKSWAIWPHVPFFLQLSTLISTTKIITSYSWQVFTLLTFATFSITPLPGVTQCLTDLQSWGAGRNTLRRLSQGSEGVWATSQQPCLVNSQSFSE